MGERSSASIKVTCQGCGTTFRLRPTKERVPRNPIACPKCDGDIYLTEEQIDAIRARIDAAPAAAVLRPRADRALLEEIEDEDDAPRPKMAPTSSTYIGMPASPDLDTSFAGGRGSAEKTVVRSLEQQAVLGRLEPRKVRADDETLKDGDLDTESEAFREALEKAQSERETKPNPQVQKDEESEAEASDEPAPSVSAGDILSEAVPASASGSRRGERETRPNLTPFTPNEKDDSPASKSGKIPLSDLLQKVRKKRGDDPAHSVPPVPRLGEDSFVRGIAGVMEATADETLEDTPLFDGSPNDRGSRARTPEQRGSASRTTENSMLTRLRKLDLSSDQLGMASERRGSGYIRLPTSEIMDVLGRGQYRLRVEDIVYEPVDEQGLVKLIKGGVLLGAEEIADADGDWMPVSEHPVFRELRRKMAEEAHALLRDVAAPAESRPKAPVPPRESADDALSVPEPTRTLNESAAKAMISKTADEAKSPTGTGGLLDETQKIDAAGVAKNDKIAGPAFDPREGEEQLEVGAMGLGGPSVGVEISEGFAAVMEHGAAEARAEEEEPRRATRTGEIGVFEPEEEAPEIVVRRRRWPLIVALLAGTGAVAAGLIATGVVDLETLRRTAELEAADQTKVAVAAEAGPQAGAAFREASALLGAAYAIDTSHTSMLAAARAHEDQDAVLHLLQARFEREPSPEVGRELAGLYLERQQWREARAVARSALALGKDSEAFETIIEESLTKQFREEAVTEIGAESGFTSITGVSSGRHVGFVLSHEDGSTWVFRPSREDGDWRFDVASYRLCELMDCNFAIPQTRAARIKKKTLEQFLAAAPQDAKELATQRFVESRRKKEVFIAGSLQEVPGEDAPFPIEQTGIWRNWLTAGYDTDALDAELSQALEPLLRQEREAVLAQMGSTTARQLAAQISSVLVFDFMVNNWDRFAPSAPRYGSRLRIANGRLHSLDNMIAFQPRASTRVRGRFSWTSRFSKSTIDSIRALERDKIDPILFPKASAAEKARLDVFWNQRDRVLQRVDSLVARHGAEDVLMFD